MTEEGQYNDGKNLLLTSFCLNIQLIRDFLTTV